MTRTLGRPLHLVTGTRRSLLAHGGCSKVPHLAEGRQLSTLWLSRGTELSPELVGHLLLCWNTAPSSPAEHRLRGCAGTAGTELHVSPTDVGNNRVLASVDVGQAALPHPARLALVQVSLGILLLAL